MTTSRRSIPRGFTLIELLVVVSIIALLIAILLPSLKRARKQAKAVVCQTRIRGLAMGAVTYAAEWGRYPASLSNFNVSGESTAPAGIDWLGVGDQFGPFIEGNENDPGSWNPKGFGQAPRLGTLWPYTNNEELYLCPEDVPGPVNKSSITGGGGNGKFSYTMFSNLGLARSERIVARMGESSGNSRGGGAAPKRLSNRAQAQTPLFVEEHPWAINDPQDGHIEGNFNLGTDFVVARHGPFTNRAGYDLRGDLGNFLQGSTEIAFADGHVEPVKVNFGFRGNDVKSTTAQPTPGLGLEGIPYTAEGLMYHFGIDDTSITTID